MLRISIAFSLLMLLAVGAAYAGIFDVLGKAVGAVNPLAGFGVGLVGSLLTGKGLKSKTPVPNDAIPASNATIWGGGVGAVTQDPIAALSALIGSIVANWLHQVAKKL